MKKAVIFYSRDGHTKEVALYISRFFQCDIAELKDRKNRKGIVGSVSAGIDAMLKKGTSIDSPDIDISGYDVLFVGTPVWGWSLAPAVRAFMSDNDLSGKKICIFCTMESTGADRTFGQMKGLIRSPEIIGAISFMAKDVDGGGYKMRLDDLLQGLRLA